MVWPPRYRDQALEYTPPAQEINAKQASPLFNVAELGTVLTALRKCWLASANTLLAKVVELVRRQGLGVRVVDRPEDIDDPQRVPAAVVLDMDRPLVQFIVDDDHFGDRDPENYRNVHLLAGEGCGVEGSLCLHRGSCVAGVEPRVESDQRIWISFSESIFNEWP